MSEPGDFVEAVRLRSGMYLGPGGALELHRMALRSLLASRPRQHLRVRREGAEVVLETDGLVAAEPVLELLHRGEPMPGGHDPWWQLLVVSALSSRFALDVLAEDGWWAWRGKAGRPVAGEPLRRAGGPGTVLRYTPDEAVLPGAGDLSLGHLLSDVSDAALLNPGLLVELDAGDGTRAAHRWPLGVADWLRARGVEPVRAVTAAWEEARLRAGFGFTGTPGVQVHGLVNGARLHGGDPLEALRTAVEARWPPAARGPLLDHSLAGGALPGSTGVVVLELPPEQLRFAGSDHSVLAVPGLREGLTGALSAAFGSP